MSRHGIDYQTVKQSALSLLKQGIAPSVQKIREVLGTGSNTTIAEHLKIWRDEYASKEIHQLPANMPKELISAFEVLWNTAMEHAQSQLAEHKKFLDLDHETSLKIQLAAENTVAELSQKMAETASKLENEATEKQKLSIELAIANNRLEEKQVTIAAQKEHYEDRLRRVYEEKDRIITQGNHLQDQFKILQEKLNVQTEQQQNLIASQNKLHEQSENRWLKLIDNSREETKDSNKKLTDLQSNYYDQSEKLKAKLLESQLARHEKDTQLKLALEHNSQLKQRYKILKEEYVKTKSTLTKLEALFKLKSAKGNTKKTRHNVEKL